MPQSQGRPPGRPSPAPGHVRGHPEVRVAAGEGGPGLRSLPAEDHRPQPAHEARRGPLFLQREEGHLLLHGRRAGRFPPAGQGPGQGAADAHRDAPGRRPGRGQDDRRPGRLRPLPVLLELHDDLRAGDHPEGPEAADRHQSDQDLGAMRPPDVLPGVRGADAGPGLLAGG
ncbi:MAG: hypothetical protein MZV64_49795 [Ignavibacteriales bacterium]|nr:hypothetical protein [Ignavibacteriales bacterium]